MVNEKLGQALSDYLTNLDIGDGTIALDPYNANDIDSLVMAIDTALARTDQEIVDQTEELAKKLLSWSHSVAVTGTNKIRDSENPRAISCWQMACQIQEMLTATDVENALANLEPPEEPAKPKYTAERNHCNCHPETCCCSDYVVLSPAGKKIAGFYTRNQAEAAAEAYTLLGRHD